MDLTEKTNAPKTKLYHKERKNHNGEKSMFSKQ